MPQICLSKRFWYFLIITHTLLTLSETYFMVKTTGDSLEFQKFKHYKTRKKDMKKDIHEGFDEEDTTGIKYYTNVGVDHTVVEFVDLNDELDGGLLVTPPVGEEVLPTEENSPVVASPLAETSFITTSGTNNTSIGRKSSFAVRPQPSESTSFDGAEFELDTNIRVPVFQVDDTSGFRSTRIESSHSSKTADVDYYEVRTKNMSPVFRSSSLRSRTSEMTYEGPEIPKRFVEPKHKKIHLEKEELLGAFDELEQLNGNDILTTDGLEKNSLIYYTDENINSEEDFMGFNDEKTSKKEKCARCNVENTNRESSHSTSSNELDTSESHFHNTKKHSTFQTNFMTGVASTITANQRSSNMRVEENSGFPSGKLAYVRTNKTTAVFESSAVPEMQTPELTSNISTRTMHIKSSNNNKKYKNKSIYKVNNTILVNLQTDYQCKSCRKKNEKIGTNRGKIKPLISTKKRVHVKCFQTSERSKLVVNPRITNLVGCKTIPLEDEGEEEALESRETTPGAWFHLENNILFRNKTIIKNEQKTSTSDLPLNDDYEVQYDVKTSSDPECDECSECSWEPLEELQDCCPQSSFPECPGSDNIEVMKGNVPIRKEVQHDLVKLLKKLLTNRNLIVQSKKKTKMPKNNRITITDMTLPAVPPTTNPCKCLNILQQQLPEYTTSDAYKGLDGGYDNQDYYYEYYYYENEPTTKPRIISKQKFKSVRKDTNNNILDNIVNDLEEGPLEKPHFYPKNKHAIKFSSPSVEKSLKTSDTEKKEDEEDFVPEVRTECEPLESMGLKIFSAAAALRSNLENTRSKLNEISKKERLIRRAMKKLSHLRRKCGSMESELNGVKMDYVIKLKELKGLEKERYKWREKFNGKLNQILKGKYIS